MRKNIKNFGFILLGLFVGLACSLKFDAIAEKNKFKPLPVEELRQLADVFGMIKSDYVEPVEDKKLLVEAISGMVASLDPHSAFLDKKAFKELREGTQGKFVGLGIEVGMEDGYVKVIAPIEDSPAYKAGLKRGDLITRLDSTPVKGMTLSDAVKKMRGEPNTKITLTILRENEDKPLLISVVRQEIRIKSVKGKIIEPGFGWVRVSQFQEPTVKDLAKKIIDLYKKEPNMKGLVLDLRNDPGGVLPGAIGVSAVFLPKDVAIVSTNGQIPDSKATYYARREFYANRLSRDPLAALPKKVKETKMVVLVNSGSASASEIVAGALQDYKRATIMGSQTFGKGSVQTIRQISADTAVKLTTARYYTPNGRSIQAKGIEPDILVDEYSDGDGINVLRQRESDLSKHLSNDDDKDSKPEKKFDETKERQKLSSLDTKRERLEFGSKEDFQLIQAIKHLKGEKVQVSKLFNEDGKN